MDGYPSICAPQTPLSQSVMLPACLPRLVTRSKRLGIFQLLPFSRACTAFVFHHAVLCTLTLPMANTHAVARLAYHLLLLRLCTGQPEISAAKTSFEAACQQHHPTPTPPPPPTSALTTTVNSIPDTSIRAALKAQFLDSVSTPCAAQHRLLCLSPLNWTSDAGI